MFEKSNGKFLFAPLSLKKISGSGVGSWSVRHRYGFVDPDPYQRVVLTGCVQGGVWTSRGAIWYPRLPGGGGSQRLASIEISRHCARQEEIPFHPVPFYLHLLMRFKNISYTVLILCVQALKILGAVSVPLYTVFITHSSRKFRSDCWPDHEK
jgi:hypothetical protein